MFIAEFRLVVTNSANAGCGRIVLTPRALQVFDVQLGDTVAVDVREGISDGVCSKDCACKWTFLVRILHCLLMKFKFILLYTTTVNRVNQNSWQRIFFPPEFTPLLFPM